MEILRTELVKQVVMKGLLTGKSFNTIDEKVVGKYVVLVKFKNGYIKTGVGVSVDLAVENAKSKYEC